jgi:hypothetical protein
MADVDTGFAGIKVQLRDTGGSHPISGDYSADSDKFVGKVKDALKTLYKKPVGKAMIDEIVANAHKGKDGVTVLICAKKSLKVVTHGGLFSKRTYERGSSTNSNMLASSTLGVGSRSTILWDPVHNSTPDGSRPPYIALAHELVHAYHNIRGTARAVKVGDVDGDHTMDEALTVGLRGYEGQAVSENRIRKEHGIPYRVSYFGECSAQDYSPDKQSLKNTPVGI